MPYNMLNKSFFVNRRAKISNDLSKNSFGIIFSSEKKHRNGDQFYQYRQNSDFYYLTGLTQDDFVLVLCPDLPNINFNEVIFAKTPNPEIEKWEGKMFTFQQIQEMNGIEKVMPIDDLKSFIQQIIPFVDTVYFNSNESVKTFNYEALNWGFRYKEILENYPALMVKKMQPLLRESRLVKQECEIELIRSACEITKDAFFRVLKSCKPNLFEYEIEAEITYEFNKNHSKHAYDPIVATGENAIVLHYTKNGERCKNGDLLLLDFGAEYKYYASDCSRTIPVGGKFTDRQREVYLAVLDVLLKTSEQYVPGNTLDAINEFAKKMLQEKMIELDLFSEDDLISIRNGEDKSNQYFYHGIGHFMGLDVHDPGFTHTVLEEGMVLTCEPGIYIEKEGIGIRLENDILVAAKPVNLMKDIPILPDEIESIMNQ